jgi:hypothetical protein
LARRGLSGVKEVPQYHPFRNRYAGIREFAGKAMRNMIGNKPEPEAGVTVETACGPGASCLHTSIIVYVETVVKELTNLAYSR